MNTHDLTCHICLHTAHGFTCYCMPIAQQLPPRIESYPLLPVFTADLYSLVIFRFDNFLWQWRGLSQLSKGLFDHQRDPIMITSISEQCSINNGHDIALYMLHMHIQLKYSTIFLTAWDFFLFFGSLLLQREVFLFNQIQAQIEIHLQL